MEPHPGERHSRAERDNPFEQHVRAGCELAEALAARIAVEGIEPLIPSIRHAWVEAELPSRCPDAWAAIWRAVAAADPACVMSRCELRRYATLPASLIAYRGFSGEGARGWSWSLQREVAEDFAVRYDQFGENSAPRVCIAQVESTAVTACLLFGGEDELIIDPDRIDWRSARVEPVGQAPGE
ncbi:hypothetical protein SAMN05421595_0674 [Austwickia chelonae]|uniref:Uncharacterized protein n=1 Tax=Austwickia chelonae NBRC 105200 TaxID=1184607 RepID=K6V7F8_9MICO|nr:hypothetical protein [Austwickia chelonae]GAB78153.1 hypothetical protein AUCHE_08_03980 [Austwickia chelonae NBRC 105200]SEV97749.1 hypothetical protein SAMN05421595_0674 [Austwickia chelonae]